MANSIPFNKEYDLVIPAIVSVVLTAFLLYLDEGYYDFRWMADPVNWIFFFVYAGMFFGFQLAIQMGLRYFFKSSRFRIILSSISCFVLLGGLYLIFK